MDVKALSPRRKSRVPAFCFRQGLAILALLGWSTLSSAPLSGQGPEHTSGAWERLEVENFLFLYPKELEAWTRSVAEQMLAVEVAVSTVVGYLPGERIQVLVDDPLRISNGMAAPGPILYLWPTPPGPRSMIGESRGWGELLAVHEYAHVAHLARPSRNPTRQWILDRAPLPLGPLWMGTPRWVSEGYATWIEGYVTGHGRPAGVWRPALFRTWALEGRLPSYRELNGSDAFLGGAYAYLVGSAFIDWLIEREGRGPQVFQDVWARMSARQSRGFDAAFQGVFGAPAEELYGLFVVDLMAQALEARAQLEAAGGLEAGELFQRSTRAIGDPVVSPNGEHLAYSRRSTEGVSSIVVVSTTPDTLSTEVRERMERRLAADPLDVPAVERIPRTQKSVASLAPQGGFPFRSPRWMADGAGLLVIRDVRVSNQQIRPELFVWNWNENTLRQVTRGEEIEEADPAPDGTWAAGTRCKAGQCDVVRIDLETGAVQTLAEGTFDAPLSSPRVSPDGTFILATTPREGYWGLVRIPADGGEPTPVGPSDGAHRFDAAFLSDGSHAVVVSTRGGLLNLERLPLVDPEAVPVALTRTLGSVVAPSPAPDGSLYFLAYHSRGIDLRRLPAPQDLELPALSPTLFPMTSSGVTPLPELFRTPLPEGRPYGVGTLNLSYLPMGSWGPDGWSGGGVLQQMDPIGRLVVHLRGASGAEGLWQGGALAARLRLGEVSMHAEAFRADPRVDEPLHRWVPGERTTGLLGSGTLDRHHDTRRQMLTAGASFEDRSAGQRVQGWIGGTWTQAFHGSPESPTHLVPSVSGQLQVGRTADRGWTRPQAEASLAIRRANTQMTLRGQVGRVTGDGAELESFALGGTPSLVLDDRVLSAMLSIPYLEQGYVRGTRYGTLEASVGAPGGGEFFLARHRVAGTEGSVRALGLRSIERLLPMPFVRIPEGSLQAGTAYVLKNRETGEGGRFQSWISLTVHP